MTSDTPVTARVPDRRIRPSRWSPALQRVVWVLAALPFAASISLGGPVVATVLAVYLRRDGRRRGAPWRWRTFLVVAWGLVPATFGAYGAAYGIDTLVAELGEREFDGAAWRVGGPVERLRMAEDLVASRRLIGRGMDELLRELGPADVLDPPGYRLAYGGLGARDNSFDFGRPALVIEFDESSPARVERVSLGRIVKDWVALPAPDDGE